MRSARVPHALHESLTTPDTEDWFMVADGDDLYVTCAQGPEGNADLKDYCPGIRLIML